MAHFGIITRKQYLRYNVMKRIALLLLLLCAATQLHAQYAPVDSLGRDTRNQVDGRRIIRTGQRTLLAGGIATVAGGALVSIPFICNRSQDGQKAGFREDMASPFLMVTGGGMEGIGKDHFFSSGKLTTLLTLLGVDFTVTVSSKTTLFALS